MEYNHSQLTLSSLLFYAELPATMFLLQFLLLLVFYAIATHFVHNIRSLPPTPFPTIPIIGHLYLFKKPLHRSLSKLSNRYGPVIFLRFGYRNVLLVSSPSVAEECFTKNDIVFANRPRLLAGKHMGYNFRGILFSPYGDHWRNLRKIASLEILSTHRLQLLSSIRTEEMRLVIQCLFEGKDKVVNVKSMVFEWTMNVMMRMIAGKKYHGRNMAEIEEAKKFQKYIKKTFRLGGSNFSDFFPMVGILGGLVKQMKELHKERDVFVQGLLEQRRMKVGATEENERCMIDVLLALQQSEPEQYDDEVIKSLMLSLLAGGTDTSASTIEWVMSVLLNNPEILRKAQDEIDTVVGHDRLVSETDVTKLSYLHCVIKETMRIHPVGPLLVPHQASEECMVGGYRVPRGTMMLVNMWAIQRDPTIWENATEFKPERFEGGEGMRDGFKLMPFGSGRRSCPGEGLAVRMVGLGLSSLLQCFDWSTGRKEMVDMTEGKGLSMTKAKPLLAMCSARPKMLKLLTQI